MMTENGHAYACGCVHGAYWCGRHDIYRVQRPWDLPPHGDPRGRGPGTKDPPPPPSKGTEWRYRYADARDVPVSQAPSPPKGIDDPDPEPACCSCHLSAPCSYCIGACTECRAYIGEGLTNEDGLCADCADTPNPGGPRG